MRKIIITISGIAILALGFLVNRLLANSKKEPENKIENSVASVYVQTAENKLVPLQIPTSGSILAKDRMEIYAEVTGVFQQGNKAFKAGTAFSKGATLIQINNDEFKASVISQRAAFKNAITGILPDLQFDYPASFDMWNDYLNAIDIESDLPELPKVKSEQESHYITGKNISTTYYNIKNLETRLKKYTIRAPFSGVLVQTAVTVGSLVNQGQKLGEFIRPGVYELELNVNATLKDLLQIGKSVKLNNIDKTKSWTGRVVRINPQVNTSTQTIQIFVEVSGKDLSEGEFIEADIDAQDVVDAIEISRSLLVNNQAIYVVIDQELSLLPVEIIFDNANTAIVKGIADGTKMLSKPVPGAFEGMKVSIIQ
ncbi:efflux transporter periplasmic adaptor subunit [Putridiphycobacter roseus]|uniref:Efflux transporter periplasmic adaptor subunit n=1 Tax=Putridiphycobacter roseus TaxID=2219161 RepID=A0A2W1NR18_9FLAO|nr:HlyD family efflux transporter periplasmic adaptor subunit [Putridiphycobacter roseus]PZE18102.1 efflux transporter periplasmic adaptor subunit [Putridiphycobacter roseus]